MARETQKEKIERLENKVNELQEIITKQNSQIDDMVNKADNTFENSSTYKQMAKQIETLELKVKAITNTAEHDRKMYDYELKRNSDLIREIQELKNESQELKNNTNIHKIKNERGAGRKARFTDTEIETIKMYRLQGKTIRELSEMFECSVGLIHKIINE